MISGTSQKLYQKAIEAFPDYQPARDCIAQRIFRVIGPSQSRQRSEQIEFYQEQLRFELGPATTRLCHLGLAELLEDEGQLEAAIEHLQLAHKLFPSHHPTRRALRHRLNEQGNHKEALALLLAELEECEELVERASLFHKAGELQLQIEGAPDSAIRYFHQALECVDDYDPSLNALETIYRKAKDVDGLIQILHKQLQYCASDPIAQDSLRLELAFLYVDIKEDSENANAQLDSILEKGIAASVDQRLAAFALRQEIDSRDRSATWSQHVESLQQGLSFALPINARAQLLNSRSQIRFRNLNDRPGAIQDLKRAVYLDPSLFSARNALLHLLPNETPQQQSKLRSLICDGLDLGNKLSDSDRHSLFLRWHQLHSITSDQTNSKNTAQAESYRGCGSSIQKTLSGLLL